MNKLFKRTINIVAIGIMVFAMNIVAFAQGTTTISVSKSSAAVGDSITVSVTATESGTVTVKYTSSMLTLSSCSASGYSSRGNSVTFDGKTGDLVFSAAAEGTASIIVSSSSCSGSSTTLTIGGGSAAAAEAPAEPEPAAEEPAAEEPAAEEPAEQPAAPAAPSGSAVGTLNADGGFDIGGVPYVVSERYKDNEIPAGFDKTTIKIGSGTYSELTNGVITLLYLKPADNTQGSGVFYIYDEAAGTVSNFVLLGDADKYVLVKDAADAPGSGFSQTVVNVNGVDVPAFTIDGAEFFYVYGQNKDQVEGWFVYDQTYGTVSRVDTSALASGSDSSDDATEVATSEPTDNSVYKEKLGLYRKIIMGLIVLCVILLFITINKILKSRGDDDDFDGDVFAKSPVKASRKLPRSIVFNNPDEDEEDEEDEDIFEDEEEEYDDYDDFSTSEGSFEERRDASLNMMDLNDL
ncbi:MAG: hypothetical protein IJS76_01270 [Pseudobutyrivibrio sp.]|nr:hypothetical protein [Pseudobutyrivibrio sp.]